MVGWRAKVLVSGLLLIASVAGCGQTLAHRNWAGSGMAVESWWVGAELYEIDPIDFADSDGDGFGDLRGLAGRLDYLQSLGVDAVVLSALPLQQRGGAQPFEAANGSVEDFDRLLEEAARRKIRVIVDVPLSAGEGNADTLAAGRFWLSRGVAGLRVVQDGSAPVSASVAWERTRELRRLCAAFAGQRVVLSAVGDVTAPAIAYPVGHGARRVATTRTGKESVAQMREESAYLHTVRLGELRGLVRSRDGSSSSFEPVALIDANGVTRSWNRLEGSAQGASGSDDAAVAKAAAALLLLGGGAPLIYFGQEVGMAGAGGPEPMQWGDEQPFTSGTPWIAMGPNAATANVAAESGDPNSLLNWYRQLGDLRRMNTALRAGTAELLRAGLPQDSSPVVTWVRRAKGGERGAAPVVVMVNLSPYAAVAGSGGVAPRGLRVLASTFPVQGPVVGAVTLPAYGVSTLR